MTYNVEDFIKLSTNNRETIKDDTHCGCYFCLSTFKGSDIEEWTDEEGSYTALCPHCGIDSVLPDITDSEALSRGLEMWFTGKISVAEMESMLMDNLEPDIKSSFDELYSQEYIAHLMEKEGPMAAEILWAGYAHGYFDAIKNKKGK